jgi:heavy metal sensor kinase
MSFIHSIKFRFTLWYLLVLVVTLVLLCAFVYVLLSQILYGNLDGSLEKDALELNRNPNLYEEVTRSNTQPPRRDLLMLCFYSGDELVRVSGQDRYSLDNETIKKVIIGRERIFFSVTSTDGEKLRCFSMRVSTENENSVPRVMQRGNDKKTVVLITGRPVEQIQDALDQLISVYLIAIPLCLIIAGGGGLFLARRALKPVDLITQTAKEIEEHDLSRRIEVKTKDEMGRLANTLNQMFDRLKKAFDSQKQFTGDASHELRAPLAIIQAEATLSLQKDRTSSEYKQSLQAISQESEYMGKIIDQLLTLARADSGNDHMIMEHLSLTGLLRDIADDLNIICRDKELALNTNFDREVAMNGDPEKLRRLFINILDNAIRYTPRGGSISILLTAEGQTAFVTISDTGIGIPADDIPYIFDRFYRVDKARSRAEGGSGLGLAICRNIVDSHGGEISVESRIGEGSIFTVKLPCKNSPDRK